MVTTVVVIIYSFPIEYAEFSCSTHTTQFCWWCTFHNAGARTIKSVFHSSAPGNVLLDAIVSKYFHIIYDETSDHKHTYMLCGSAHHTTQGDWDRVVCSNLVFSEMLKSHPPIAKQKGFRRHAILRKTSSRWLLCSAFVQSTCPRPPAPFTSKNMHTVPTISFCYLCKCLLIWLLKSSFRIPFPSQPLRIHLHFPFHGWQHFV